MGAGQDQQSHWPTAADWGAVNRLAHPTEVPWLFQEIVFAAEQRGSGPVSLFWRWSVDLSDAPFPDL